MKIANRLALMEAASFFGAKQQKRYSEQQEMRLLIKPKPFAKNTKSPSSLNPYSPNSSPDLPEVDNLLQKYLTQSQDAF